MGREVRIPVRVVRPTESKIARPADEPAIPKNGQQANTPLPREASGSRRDWELESTAERQEAAAGKEDRQLIEGAKTDTITPDEPQGQLVEWRERALRLQAEMENYRKRQQRAAQDQIRQERNRLLNAFLEIADDLERALAAPAAGGAPSHAEGLQRGVELTHRAALQLLEKEGAVAIEAKGQPFDPNWHEAVATVPRNGHRVEPGTVLEVVEPGYRIKDELLRPAKVMVAV
jgi:molecular chaperone GrpE